MNKIQAAFKLWWDKSGPPYGNKAESFDAFASGAEWQRVQDAQIAWGKDGKWNLMIPEFGHHAEAYTSPIADAIRKEER